MLTSNDIKQLVTFTNVTLANNNIKTYIFL